MKTDIILSGVGGQGILSIATVIGKAALKEGLYMNMKDEEPKIINNFILIVSIFVYRILQFWTVIWSVR